jgi:hypothetical protein
MRKIIVLLVLSILVLSGLGAVSVSSEEINEEQKVLKFSNLLVEEKNDYIDLKLDGTDSKFLAKNHYIVPEKTETFTFPFGTKIKDIKCSPRNVHIKELNKKLQITPEPFTTDMTVLKQTDQIKENAISIDTWYDYRVGTGIENGELKTILKVQVFPIQYNPSENKIDWAEEVEIEIDYELPEPSFNKMDEVYDFVILTPEEFSGELSALVSHKEGRGISTKLVTLNEIYSGTYFPVNGRDEPEQIKYFIKNAIENWNTIYVMLVGGFDEFPNRETHIFVNYGSGDDEVFVTDLYYADIYDEEAEFASWDTNENDVFGEFDWGEDELNDEVDLFPDVYLNRIACTSSFQVSTVVNKVITYENNQAYTQDWFSNIIVIGGDTSPNDEEGVDEGEYTNQAILDIMDGFIPDKIWDSNRRLSGFSPSGLTNINNGINAGCGFLDFAGHGAPTVWTTYPHNGNRQSLPTPTGLYRTSHISDLSNGDKLPIVITGACSPSKYMSDDNCFSWAYLSNPNGGGIASFAPNSLSWGYTTSYCIEDLGGRMHLELYRAYKEDGAFTFGEMWAKGVSNYIHTGMDGGDHKTIQQWQPFGDPTLSIGEESQPPNKPSSPDGPNSGDAGESYTYESTTTDPEGDKISFLFDWGDGTYSQWTDFKNSGEVASASHSWSKSGDYEIRVKAKDEHGVLSEWSDSLSISLPRNRLNQFAILEKIWERFPNAFPLLQYFLRR